MHLYRLQQLWLDGGHTSFFSPIELKRLRSRNNFKIYQIIDLGLHSYIHALGKDIECSKINKFWSVTVIEGCLTCDLKVNRLSQQAGVYVTYQGATRPRFRPDICRDFPSWFRTLQSLMDESGTSPFQLCLALHGLEVFYKRFEMMR